MYSYFAVFLTFLLIGCTDSGGYYLESKSSPSSSGASISASDGNSLVLPLEVDLQVAEAFVKIGFGLNKDQRFESTEFLTPRLRSTQTVTLIRLVKHYNEFDGERVALAVEKLRGRVSGVEFGREGSPVLYIELPYWTHQREESLRNGAGTKISDAENDKLIQDLKQVFVGELKADEFSVAQRRVRVWWD